MTVTAADVTTSRVSQGIAAALLRSGLPAGALVVSLDRDSLVAHPDEAPPLQAGASPALSRRCAGVAEEFGRRLRRSAPVPPSPVAR